MEQEQLATIMQFLERKMNNEEHKEYDTIPPAPKRKFEEEEVREVHSSGLDQQDEKLINRKQLWMLCRNKYCLTFNLCPTCNEKLFQRKEKVKEISNGVVVSFELCWDCVKRNMTIADLARVPNEKKYNK